MWASLPIASSPEHCLPSYPVLVHQFASLLHASFRPRLAAGVISPLRFAITSRPSRCEEDLHLQAVEHARHTIENHGGEEAAVANLTLRSKVGRLSRFPRPFSTPVLVCPSAPDLLERRCRSRGLPHPRLGFVSLGVPA